MKALLMKDWMTTKGLIKQCHLVKMKVFQKVV